MKLPDWTRRPRKAALAVFRRVHHWTRSLVRFGQAKRGSLALLVLVVAVGVGIWSAVNYWDWLSTTFWDWLRDGPDGMESGSTTIRNLGLVIGGVVAIVLAVWRSSIAKRQADTAEHGLLNERYQRGAEMIGSDVLSVRLGGIYALQRLAEEHPEQYHVQIMKLLCAFLRHPTRDGSGEAKQVAINPESGHDDRRDDSHAFAREDVYIATQIIRARNQRKRRLEEQAGYALDLHGADLRRSDIRDAHLSRSDLRLARLSGAQLIDADLSGAQLQHADLSSPLGATRMDTVDPTDLKNIDLTDITRLDGSVLSDVEALGADFSSAILDHVDLSGASLPLANLSGSRLMNADLSNTNLLYADLSDAELIGAKLLGAGLQDAILSGTDLSGSRLSGLAVTPKHPVTGLTQAQLDKARADPDNPPKLDGVLDAETGKQLVWRGKPQDVA